MRHTIARTATAAVVLFASACGSDPTVGDSTGEDSTMPDDTQPPTTDPAATEAPQEAPPTTEPTVTDGTEPAVTPTTAEPEPVSSESTTTQPVATEAPSNEEPVSTIDRLGQLAATDLSERLGIDISSVNVIDVEEVTWSDASLGCPQKDFQYAQVLTPGVRIMLTAQEISYTYHAGADRDPFYCVDPQQPV